MNTRALAQEMRESYAGMRRVDIQHLVGLGIPEILLDHFQMVGLARVREVSSTRYIPDPRGRLVYITPVCVHRQDTPESTRPEAFQLIGNLIDLCAWDERCPDQWRLRTAEGLWLGAIEPQYLRPSSVRVRRSPLSWLRNRCIGLVPLSRDPADIRRVLSFCIGGIVPEDAQHRVQLRDAQKEQRNAA